MFKKILKILSVLIFGVLIIFTLSFSSLEVKNVKCNKIEVLYDGHQSISLGKEEIIKMINQSIDSIQKKNINEINAEFIELEVEKNKPIENAEVYKSIIGKGNNYEGILTVKVKFREPVFRVMGNENYFLDKNKVQIPASTNYTANVLVATGKIDADFARNELFSFVEYISNDDFLNALIKQIHVQGNQEVILTPLVGDNLIEIGTLDDYENKMEHLKVFYEEVLAKNNWNKYNKISLKYKNQVIGTKR